jgi:small ligand-binding sensory domain FIST
MPWAAAAVVDASPPVALDRALDDVTSSLAGERVDLAFLFAAPVHLRDPEAALRRVREALGGAPVVGCSAGGIIGAGREYEQQPALSLLAGGSEGASVRVSHVPPDRLPDADAGPSAWHALTGVAPSENPSFVILGDPFTLPPDRLVGGLDYAYPDAVKVGGLASGAQRAGEQVMLAGDRVVREGGVVVALSGALRIEPAVAQGCRPVGRPFRITRCEGHLLLQMDQKAALEALQEVYAEATERDRRLMQSSLFLGFATDPLGDADGPWLIRNLQGVHPKNGGLFVGEELRVGRVVRFHVRDRVSSAEDVARTLQRASWSGSQPEGALLFSCLGRGMHLYGAPDHDSRAFADRFGHVPLAGFFCSGEIGPVGGTTHLHGYTSAFGLLVRR